MTSTLKPINLKFTVIVGAMANAVQQAFLPPLANPGNMDDAKI